MPRQSTRNPKTPWGKYVQQALSERGYSPRGQFPLTKIPHSTVDGWLSDAPPSRANAVKFALAFGKELNEALLAAGFAPDEPIPTPGIAEQDPSYQAAYMGEIEAMKARLREQGLNLPVPETGAHHGGTSGLTADDAKAEVAVLEQLLKQAFEK